ncbi:MAG: ABC transporter ATP-binding protein [Acidobacteria bacterium]|nr:ABC transporter ATP-binding protein [Acidobacteriota bacterium]
MSMRGGMGRGMGGAPAKAQNFGPSVKRILSLMRPDRIRLVAVVVLAAIGVGLTVLAPKILGHATDLIFAAVAGHLLGQNFPGMSKTQAIDVLRQHGQGQLADMLNAVNVVPGQGLDTAALGAVMLTVLALYASSFVFNYSQGYINAGIVQRAMYRLRRNIEDKLDVLPMSHFQETSRGDVLSKVTNDIDNLAQTLNQTLTQLLVSVLTVVGVLVMMFSISWQLALIALVSVPLMAYITVTIAKRSAVQFGKQWATMGKLNGHIEEIFTGHEIVKAFGQQRQAISTFAASNEELFRSSSKAQFISGIIMPAMNFVSNLNYVAVAVVGGIQVASGIITIGSVQAFIQYSRQFSQPLAQLGSMANLLQSGVAPLIDCLFFIEAF